MRYIYTMEYCSAIKQNGIGSFADMDGPKDYHTEWNKPETEKQIYMNAYIW